MGRLRLVWWVGYGDIILTGDEQLKLVLIEWVDSFGCSSDWQELEDDPQPLKPIICQSVGWLLRDWTQCKVIVPHIAEIPRDSTLQGCGDMTIPTACILRMVDLSEVTPP